MKRYGVKAKEQRVIINITALFFVVKILFWDSPVNRSSSCCLFCRDAARCLYYCKL